MIDLNELASQAYITGKKREKNGAFIHMEKNRLRAEKMGDKL